MKRMDISAPPSCCGGNPETDLAALAPQARLQALREVYRLADIIVSPRSEVDPDEARRHLRDILEQLGSAQDHLSQD